MPEVGELKNKNSGECVVIMLPICEGFGSTVCQQIENYS